VNVRLGAAAAASAPASQPDSDSKENQMKRISSHLALSQRSALAALIAAVAAASLLAASASGAPTAGATKIATAAGPFGTMLVVGSGKDAGFALYFITSDVPPSYGCKTTVIPFLGHHYQCAGPPSDSNADWPALTTKGAPVAGPGVSQKLLGTVTRRGIGTQVTYAGHPLYLFDSGPVAVTGEGWDEPGIPPDFGLWYLISPQGSPLAWPDMLTPTKLAGGKTVLGATMLDAGSWHVFPLYSFSADSATTSKCTGACALAWPPLLTSGTPGLSGGLKASSFGTLKRSDGTIQVTFDGKPLYYYSRESATKGADGAYALLGSGSGLKGPGGTFRLITP
jgi:predicted lipoprotein with Yx(FWY)xxD motif